MKKSLPWARITAEGAVIVLSILLALGLEAWWSGIETRRAALRELTSVQAEIIQARTELEQILLWDLRAQAGARGISEALRGVSLGSNATLTDTVVSSAFFAQVNDAPTGAANAFVASGYPSELDDPELRGLLLAWTSRIADLRDDEEYGREMFSQLARDLGEAGVDLSGMGDGAMAVYMSGPSTPARSAGESIQIPSTVLIRNLSNGYAQWLQLLVFQLGSVVEEADNLIARIDQVHR